MLVFRGAAAAAADDGLGEDFFAEDFLAVDFLAVDFLAVDFLADDFFADDFFDDFFADDVLPDDDRDVFDEAVAPPDARTRSVCPAISFAPRMPFRAFRRATVSP